MKISTKGRYGLRLMLDLAMNTEEGFVAIKNIAQRQEISEKYLEQIITQLSQAKLVKSARGAQGGYKLSKAPQDYTVGEILRSLEGSLAPVSCLEGRCSPCHRSAKCATLDLWKELQLAINAVLDKTTLADLVAKQKQKLS